MKKTTNMKCLKELDKESLTQINGGGTVWKWLGVICGEIKNTVEDAWENWSEDCAYNAGMAKC